MRIIAGKYGGRKLVAFKAKHIRPTTDRVKESIFNKLQFILPDARVLDLFSGTGNLAIEALSRDAQFVWAVESSAQSLIIINKNKELLKIGDELKVTQMDVFKFLKQKTQAFDIILIDPPFTKRIADDVLVALAQSDCLVANTEVFIESTTHEEVKESYGTLIRKSHKSYGDKFLSHYIFG